MLKFKLFVKYIYKERKESYNLKHRDLLKKYDNNKGNKHTHIYTMANSDLEDLRDVTYGNGKFVSVGIDGTIIYSDNGFSWNSIITRPKVGLRGIEYGNNRFIAVGGHKYFTSIDGKSWNSIDNPGKNLWGITFGDSIFVSVGDLGTIMTSFGETWSFSYSETTSRISGVTYGNGFFVAVNQKGEILTSKFGNDWFLTSYFC